MTVKNIDKHSRTSTGAANVVIEGLAISRDGVSRQLVEDETAQSILRDVLTELKKINFHLSIMTDTIINDSEVNNA